MVSPDEISLWKPLTSGAFSLETLPGDHWFLFRNREIIRKRLSELIQSVSNPVLEMDLNLDELVTK